jgi:nucleoside-diphosphate-sugar epimerase
MKSVVTGYGFIGRHLVDALTRRGDEVVVIEKRDVQLPKGAIRADARYIEGPIVCDNVFHLAGLTNYAYCEANPLECIEANVMSTMNVIRKVRPTGKFVLASSAAVYIPNDMPLRENHPIGPRSVYGASKRAAEILVEAGCDRFLIARFFNVYGPGQSLSFIVPQLVHQAGEEGRITIRNRDTYRDYIYIADAVEALLAGTDAKSNMVMNIGTGQRTSTGELAETIASLLGNIQVVSGKTYDSYSPRALCAEISRARALGWEPKFSLREGVRATIDS